MVTINSANEKTAASGKVLQGQGVGTASDFSSATYPSTAGTAGTVLISDGTNIVSSTPTFPNASATSGKFIQSDGTNWVASTPTLAAPGTSGNILQSDGTNWTSATGSGLITVAGQLTSAQIKALHATPIQVVAAQSGKVIWVVSFFGSYVYGGSNVFVAGAAQQIVVALGTTGVVTLASNATLVGTASNVTGSQTFTVSAQPTATYNNVALNLYNSSATEISGNAANDNLINWSITYKVITL